MKMPRKPVLPLSCCVILVLAVAAGAVAAEPSRLEQALREVRDINADIHSRKSSVLAMLAGPEEMAAQQMCSRPDPRPVAGINRDIQFDANTVERAAKMDVEHMHKLPSRFGSRALPLGTTGAYFTEFQKRSELLVVHVLDGTPAAGVLKVEDVIIGANGRLFVDREDPRPEMGCALVESQSPELGGILTLHVVRDKKPMTVKIDLGSKVSYSETWPMNCEKTLQIRQDALKYVMDNYPWDRRDFWTPLFLMASGDDAALELARRFLCADLKNEYPQGRGCSAWNGGYELINLCEYYLLTGDSSVLPAIKYQAECVAWAQYRSGSWSHGGGGPLLPAPGTADGGYGEINCAGLGAFVGLCLARQCGIEPYDHTIPRSVRFFGKFCGTNFPYGLGTPGMRGGRMDNGMNSMAAVGFHLLGEDEMADRWARTVCYMWMARERGHAEAIFSAAWGPVGAALAPAPEFHAFMNHMRWAYELGRARDGSLTFMRGGRWTSPNATAAMGLFLYLPEHRLQILGGDSVFAHRPPEELKDAAWLFRQKRWKELKSSLNEYIASKPAKAENMTYAHKLLDAYNRMENHAAATVKIIGQTIQNGDTATAGVQLDLLDRMLGEARPESAALRKQLAGAGKGPKRGKGDRPKPLIDEKAIVASLGLGKGGIDNGFGCSSPYIREVNKQGFEGMTPEQIARFFNSPSHCVVDGAEAALAEQGPKVMPLLKRLLTDEHPGVRAAALGVISELYKSDSEEYSFTEIPAEQQEIINLVQPMTKDPSQWVRNAATGVMLNMKVVNKDVCEVLRDMAKLEGARIDKCVRYGIKDPALRVELCMELINTNNRCKTKEPEEYKPISWAVGAHLTLCGPYVQTAIDTLNNPEAVTMYGFFSQAPGNMSMELLFAHHDNPLVLKHLGDVLRFGVRRHEEINHYWVTCTEFPHRIVIALGPKALPIVEEFFKSERELYERIAAGQEEKPVWWKEDSVEHLETWCKDMQVTAEMVKCLYGVTPEDQAVTSLCDIYSSNREWGSWERQQIRDHFTKLGVKVTPALRQAGVGGGKSAKADLDKEIVAKQAQVEAAGKSRDKERRQKELDALLQDARRYDELSELASVIDAMNADTPSAGDVRTLCRFYVKRPWGSAYSFTKEDNDYVRKFDETQLALIRDRLQQWGKAALPALRAFLAEDATALAESIAQLDKDKAYWSEQRARLRGGPLARIAIEREDVQTIRAELKDLADLVECAGQDKLSGEQVASLCRMYTRRAWPAQNKLIAELLKRTGKDAAAVIAQHVRQESQALPEIQAAIEKGMEDPSSTAKKWRYDRAVDLDKNIRRGIKELADIR